MKKEVILFVHGMWCGAGVWKFFKDFFEDLGYICIIPTLRYHEEEYINCPHPELKNTSILDYVEDMVKVIQEIQDECGELPIIIGHSMGGWIAHKLASLGLAKAAVLLAPAAPRGVVALNWKVLKSFIGMLSREWPFWENVIKPKPAEAAYSVFNLVPEDRRMAIYENLGFEAGKCSFELGFAYADKSRAAEIRFADVKCPMQFLTGLKDNIVPASAVKKTFRKYTGPWARIRRSIKQEEEPIVELVTFPCRAHWLLGEEPEREENEVLRQIVAFLEKA